MYLNFINILTFSVNVKMVSLPKTTEKILALTSTSAAVPIFARSSPNATTEMVATIVFAGQVMTAMASNATESRNMKLQLRITITAPWECAAIVLRMLTAMKVSACVATASSETATIVE